ncbi:LysR family transcriptional regulator [Allopusillimonas ginsengisoli]|uniref:LysR family transcriptional regulator n=1 Tax=Allopusillimonas ginsengisoli TaxID=453575 RepID=UPI0039C306CC
MRPHFPSLAALAAFEIVYRRLSISEAAHELSLTQSAVSKQIKALELFFGHDLFERRARGLVATPAADLLAARLAPCLDQMEGLVREMHAVRQGGGVLKLAVVPTFATRWLMPRLRHLAQHHPNLVLNLSTQLDRFEFAGSGLDAGIIFGTPDWPNCDYSLIATENQVVVCSPDFLQRFGRPAKRKDLSGFPLLHSASRPNAWSRWFEAHGQPEPAGISGPRFDLFSMVAEAALAGLGIALLPEILIREELKQRALVALFPVETYSEGAYYFIYPKHKAHMSGLQTFQTWLLAQAASQ